MSDYNDDGLGPFALQGAILRAWSTTVMTVLDGCEGRRDKVFKSHAVRFEDSDTMLFFGYVAQAVDQTIMQCAIVEALVPNPDKRQAKRQDIRRRADAVEFFKLIKREKLTKVAVQFSLTKKGRDVLAMYEAAYAAEVRKLKGDEDVKYDAEVRKLKGDEDVKYDAYMPTRSSLALGRFPDPGVASNGR